MLQHRAASGDDSARCSEHSSLWARAEAHQGDLLAFATGVTYAIGAPLAGLVADRFFQRRLKRLLMLSTGVFAVNFAFVVALLPPPPSFGESRTREHRDIRRC
jgi:MFS family permease